MHTSAALRRWSILALLALALGLGGAVSSSKPAHAATPTCNFSIDGYYIYNSSVVAYRPYYFNYSNYYQQMDCVLYQGVNNGAVTTLQKTLNACYGESLATDGSYGPLTKAAVKRAQQYHRISDDGVAGPITLSKLKWLNSSGSCFLQQFYNFPYIE